MMDIAHPHGTSDTGSGAINNCTNEYDDAEALHHDPYLKPISPALMSLAQSIFEKTEVVRSVSARRKPRRDAVERRKVLTLNLIANLAALHEVADIRSYVALPMGQLKRSRYDRPDFHTKMLRELVELLVTLGWVIRREAVYKKLRTTIRPSKVLWGELSKLGAGPHVGRDEGGESIILRAKSEDERTRPLVDYAETKETNKLRAEIDCLNESIKNADIRFNGKCISWTHLVRNYQNPSLQEPYCFNRVGRLSGGFWMSLPKAQRGLITLNEEQLCDLDFRSSFVALAYHQAGASQPSVDAYESIDGLSRADAKIGLLALLCRSGAMLRLPEDLQHLYAEGWTGPRFEEVMRQRHPDIANLFGSAIGLHLMWLESSILVKALLNLSQQGLPALGMHDGLMIGCSQEQLAKEAMRAASIEILGEPLTITSKPVLLNSFPQSLKSH